MIVRPSGRNLHLITQPDHAALSGQVMQEWSALASAQRRESIALAIEAHDNGWQEVDARPMVDPATGRIFDFITAPAEVRQSVWPRGIRRVAERDAWAAALIAEHALTIYERYRGEPEWAGFFAEIEELRARLLDGNGTPGQLRADYEYVRVGDLLSLVFCNRWRQEHTFERWSIRGDGGNLVVVTPDPFGGREVVRTIGAREIPDVVYASDADLQRALLEAPRVMLRAVFRGA